VTAYLGGAPGPAAILIGGRGNALSAARTLGRVGVDVFVLPDRGDRGPVSSRYVQAVPDWPRSSPERETTEYWLECLERRSAAISGAVLIPCSDDALEFLALHRDRLGDAGYRPAPANDQAVMDMLDKHRTYELARKASIEAPNAVTIGSLAELRHLVADFDFPCALKPVYSHRFQRHFQVKAFVVGSVEELEKRYRAIEGTGAEILLTEIVPGIDDEYCSYYTYLEPDGTPLVALTKRKLRQYPNGFGMGSYHVTKWEPEAADLGLRFARAVGIAGLVNVEFKRDARDGRLKLIECNVRLTAANEVVRRAGIDFARILYDKALGRSPVLPTGFHEGVYEWHPVGDYRAFREYHSSGRLSTASWVRSLLYRRVAIPDVALDDPYPLISKVLDHIRGGG
jgi:predicted ATP-grasp superfamily ATP-dependent carboligase